MLRTYPAAFIKDEDTFTVIFPDLNHLATYGSDIEDARQYAVECLAGYIVTVEESGEYVPEAPVTDALDLDRLASLADISPDEITFAENITVDPYVYAREHFDKPVRKSVTIPMWVNKRAMEAGINFSQTLKEALIAKLEVL